MRKILIVFSDPLIFGRGHFTRQKYLAQVLAGGGFEVKLLVNGSPLDSLVNFEFLLLDLSDQDVSPPEDILEAFKFVVGFDWSRNFVPDLNFVVFSHTRKVYPSKIETYIGFDYLIFDNRFTSNIKDTGASLDRYQLISIGFSAKSNKILEALEVAYEFSNLPIKICSGVELDFVHNNSVEILRNPDNYVQLVQDSEIIYTNGASTLLEAMLLKKRIVALPQTVDEEFFIAEIENRLGVAFTPSKRNKNFLEYDTSKIFDAKGAMRIVEVLGEYLH